MRKLILAIVLFLALALPATASADIAPPDHAPGTNPEPGTTATGVRMMDETVEISILADVPADSLGHARVNANFNMLNLGTSAETMAVRFPLGTNNGWGEIAEITDMSVKVNGTAARIRNITVEDLPWIEFDVTFEPGMNIPIQVSYTLEATGEMPYIWFYYLFSTGAGWQGTIGSAVLTATFPYPVTDLFLLPCVNDPYNCTTPDGVTSGRMITWTWKDFEPGDQDNFMLVIAAPSVWQQALNEQETLAAHPDDGEAWGRLGKIYKSLIFSSHGWRGFRTSSYQADTGVQQLFELSDQAYTKAVTLKPNDALWHAGYAELLGYYAYFAGYEGIDTLPLKIKALQEIHLALDLAPNDETVKNIAQSFAYNLTEGGITTTDNVVFDFPWLTRTPVPTETMINPLPPTETPIPMETPTPVSQVTPTVENSPTPSATIAIVLQTATMTPGPGQGSKGRLPICGGAALIPLLIVTGMKMRHNKSRK